MIGVKTTVTMERTLYLDLPDNTNEEDILKKAEKEIILPTDAIAMSVKALKAVHINIEHLDLKDWEVSNIKKEIVKNENT